MLFAASSASPTRQPASRRAAPSILVPLSQRASTIPSFIATRQSRRTSDCFCRRYARFVRPSFSRASLSPPIIIIVGNQHGRILCVCKKIYFCPRDIFIRALFSFSSSLFPLRENESVRQVRFHDGRFSRRFSRGPIFTEQSPPSAESKGTWMNGRRSVVSARMPR